MTVKTISLTIHSQGNTDIQDISGAVEDAILQSGLKMGTVTVFCPSSTSAVTTIEYESGCLSDLRRLFNEIIDPRQAYQHNAKWGDGNGHSHVRAALLGPSLTVPFVEGRLTLGTWQQVVFVDFDVRPRQRQLVVQVMGE
jgi:secondary thiamine-phosphate synthase enzyme